MRKKIETGPNNTRLMVVDDLSPENEAMLQALYSRSSESAETLLARVESKGSSRFWDNYVVGYNHKSIADCGTTTIFFENVSTLFAKAIQDWPLYCGQETSTRYIDMSKQPIVDPLNRPDIMKNWMDFYTSSQAPIAEHIRQRYPRKPEEKQEDYDRAVQARTFDTLRGFLPAGICTQLSWHTNLRQAGDHLVGLTKHPTAEVSIHAVATRALLCDVYPSSGLGGDLANVTGVSNKDTNAALARQAWNKDVADLFTYFPNDAEDPGPGELDEPIFSFTDGLDELVSIPSLIGPSFDRAIDLIKSRPRGAILPHLLAALGVIRAAFNMDFGSFRDLQRHRNGVCMMPLLTTDLGFEPWYLQELGPLEAAGRALVEKQTELIASLKGDPVEKQYYCGLGFRVCCRIAHGLPAFVYILEMRSPKTVHPTYRARIHQLIRLFQKDFPNVALHVDLDPDDWTVRRGTQTIKERIPQDAGG